MTLTTAEELAEALDEVHSAQTEDERKAALARYVAAERAHFAKLGIDVQGGGWLTRLLPVVLIVFLIVIAVIGIGNASKTSDLAQRTADLSRENTERIAANHEAQVAACQLGNRKLRRKINQRVVAPLHDLIVGVRSITPGGPVTDVLDRALDELQTVPYALCNHLYPASGKPQPPFFRRAPLPRPLHLSHTGAGVGTGASPGPSVATPATTSPGSLPAPSQQSPPASGGQQPSTGATGPQGEPGPQGPPGDGPPTGPQQPPPEQPGVLDPICTVVSDLGVPLC